MPRHLVFLLSAVLLTLTAFAGFYLHLQHTTADARADAEAVYASITAELMGAIKTGRVELETLADAPEIGTPDPARCGAPLADALARGERVFDVFLRVRATGMLDCTPKGGGMQVDLSERLYFKKAVSEGRFVVGEFLIGKVSKEPVLAVALPVFDEAGGLDFVLVAGLKTDWLADRIAEIETKTDLAIELQDASGTLFSYFTQGAAHMVGRGERVELMRSAILPDQSDAQIVIYEQT